MKALLRLTLCISFLSGLNLSAAPEKVRTSQSEYERNIKSVVRNKIHFKQGRIEVGVIGGMLPYDSISKAYSGGARLTWHLSDHLAWEVFNGMVYFNKTSNFTNGLLSAHPNITNLQAPRLKTVATTSLLISPLYGKIHIAGRWSIYFDIYLSIGAGVSNVETVQYTAPGSQNVLRTAWDPTGNLGIGFKFFVTNGFGLSLELRDYIVHTQAYNSKRLRSFFSTVLGLTLFIPSFG